MNDRPLIGVVPLMDYKLESLWMLPGYMDGITEAGGTPVMLPLTEDPATIRQLVSLCDGILVTGGQDVAPEMYGESASPEYLAMNPELSPELDRMEMALIPEVIAADKPMLGICRGIQILNAVLGGTMWHDLPTELPSDVEHHMPNNTTCRTRRTTCSGTRSNWFLARRSPSWWRLRGRAVASR